VDSGPLLHLAIVTIDFGVLVLIWLVQLVIYPSLTYMTAHSLRKWHPIYTRQVTYVVLPLMLSQAALAVYWCVYDCTTFTCLHLALVAIAWIITFGRAVPLHSALDHNETPTREATQLVRVNWYRTVVWSLVWVVGVSPLLL